MLAKAIIILFFLAILAALGTAFYSLVRPGPRTERTVRALTYRVILSVALFLLLLLGFLTGVLHPHGI